MTYILGIAVQQVRTLKYNDFFQEAERAGADGIELDVQLTKMEKSSLFMMKK